MDREEIREQFSPILDDELTADERAAVESELAQDAELLRELHALKRVDELYRRMPPAQAPAGFEAGVRERLRPNVLRIPASVFTRRRFAGLAAAAAALVLVAGIVLLQYGPEAGRFDMAAKSAPQPSVMAEEALQLRAPASASSTAPAKMAADATAPASEPVTQAGAPMQSETKEDLDDDFSYSQGEGRASSRRGEAAESHPSSRERAKDALKGTGARGGVSRDALDERVSGASETAAIGFDAVSGQHAAQADLSAGAVPRRDVAEHLPTEQRDSLYQAALEPPKQESETPSVESQITPQDAPASQPRMIAGLPAATDGLDKQMPSAPAPPAMSNEAAPPLVPAEEPDRLFWELDRSDRKAESASTASIETEAAPVAAPAPALPQAVAQDRAETNGKRQNVADGGDTRVRGKESTAPEAEQKTAKSDTEGGAAMRTSPPPPAAEVQLPDTKRIVGQRVFNLRDGVWRQSGYSSEAVVLLDRTSDVARQLLDKDPTLKDVYAFDKPVIFRAQDHWYRLDPEKK